jgi:ribosome maturation factor RimP
MGHWPIFCGREIFRIEAMRQVPERLKNLVEPVVKGLGYEAVGLEFDARIHTLRVYIDRPEGITLEDCEAVSHQLSGLLDVENPIPGKYNLEVSSPGLDRPLFTPEQFQRFIGQGVRLQTRLPLDGRRNFSGRILAADGGTVRLDVEGAEFEIPFGGIDVARLVPELAGYQPRKKGKQ